MTINANSGRILLKSPVRLALLVLMFATGALLLLLLTQGQSAHAATFTVNSTADAVDAAPGNGACATAGGVCTLRAAIQEANALAGADTITLPAGTYTLTIAGAGEDASATGDLDITGGLTINGAGAGTTIVDGGALDRVFHVIGAITVQMTAVTVRNGSAIGVALGANGGGILSNDSGTLTLNSSTISGNTAARYGGGIWNVGILTLNSSSVSGNTAASDGGGIYHGGGILTLNSSTVSGNSGAGGSGGGIYSQATMTITNSTISGNTSFSGGIFNQGALTLNSSTVSGNGGYGIDNRFGSATLKNTIVANSAGGNCLGTMTSGGHNLSSDATCAFGGAGDLNSTNPLLGPLALNPPGSTETHALLAGSPAIDAGDNAGCPATDQRGVPRPQGAKCDIGAYEVGALPTPTPTPMPVGGIVELVSAPPDSPRSRANDSGASPSPAVVLAAGVAALGTGLAAAAWYVLRRRLQ